jgi:phage tail P2-like protein
MIDLRSPTLSLLDFLPSSIKSEPEIVAMSKALDPEIRAVVAAIAEANILPRIDDQPEWVLDELAWAFKIDELLAWSAIDANGFPVQAPISGKRAILRNIIALQRKAGTRWAVRRVVELLGVTARLIEWFVDGGDPYTYRLEVTVTDEPLTEIQQQAVIEIAKRFAPVRSRMSDFSVVAEQSGPLSLRAIPTSGRHVTIEFGGP